MTPRQPPAALAAFSVTVLAVVGLLLLWRSGSAALYLVRAVFYPFELDYGEGIVLQQALLVTGPRAYGDITQYPFIVFHYPPVYLLAVRAVAALGVDILVAGRLVSLASTAAILAMVFHGARLLASPLPGAARLCGASFAVMLVLSAPVIGWWGALARVDMLAVALSLAAVLLAAHSAGSSARLYGAVLLAVLAVFAKQTSIAAPVAIVFGLLLTRPRDGVRAMIAGLGAGLILAAILVVATDGGFFRHLVLYNANRFSGARMVQWLVAFLVLGGGGLVVMVMLAFTSGSRWVLGERWRTAAQRVRIGGDPRALLLLMLGIAIPIATALLLLMGKSGSNLNYAIEWIGWSAMPAGMALALMTAAATGAAKADGRVPRLSALPALFLLPALIMGGGDDGADTGDNHRALRAALFEEIRATSAPVLSDDMVLLVRAGKEVPWEPAILAELAAAGRWDEALQIGLIRARHFAFIVTEGRPGMALFDSRYNPPVAEAIAEAYPLRETRGSLTVHRPRE